MSQTAQAVENALKGEKTFQTVQFAITGDQETDLIAGVMAVVHDCIGTNRNPVQPVYGPPASAYWAAHRVLTYLSGRVRAEAELAQGREDSYKQMSQASMGSWKEIAPLHPGSAAPGVGGLGGQIYGSSSAQANVHPQMSQAPISLQQTMRQRKQIDQMSEILKKMEEP